MKFKIIISVILFACLSVYASFASANPVKNENATVQLLSEYDAVQPGQTFWLMLSLKLKPGWHSYWQNPGEIGLAPSLKWQSPGFSFGNINYLPPKRFETSGIVSFGYSDTANYLIPVTVDASDATSEQSSINLQVDYLVCEEECIPEKASLSLPISIAAESKASSDHSKIEAIVQQLPKQFPGGASFSTTTKEIKLDLPLTGMAEPIKQAYFFPQKESIISISEPQTVNIENNQASITLQRSFSAVPENLTGVIKLSSTDKDNYYTVSASPGAEAASGLFSNELWQAILFALIGGLILNIMPCVFPILSLKILSITNQAQGKQSQIIVSGLMYTLGIVLSFLALAVIMILLKSGGEALGWGFQMQSPVFVAILTLLMFVIGLNLSGYFEFTSSLSGVGNQLTQHKNHYASSFFTGVLATLVATPCTAPFMGVAMGYAFTQPPVVILMLFIMLGLGLALPFLLLCIIPGLVKILPKPGAWMLTFKQLMAFPMYGAAIWLAWVLVQQVGANGLGLLLITALVISFAIWLRSKQTNRLRKNIMSLLFAVLTVFFLYEIHQAPDVEQHPEKIDGSVKQVFSTEKLNSYLQEGKPVFVNATAAWCITCKVNERTVLSSNQFLDELKSHGIQYLVADWTNKDQEITDYIESFNRKGVPLYVFYPRNGKPVVLPQILTTAKIVSLFNSQPETSQGENSDEEITN